MNGDLLSIGAVAEATGTTVPTIRHYDQLGLVRVAARVGGQRRFDRDTVGRVNFVRLAQEGGFRLDEILSILDDRSGGWRQLVDAKLDELHERRARMDEMIALLIEMRECGCDVVASCSRVGDRLSGFEGARSPMQRVPQPREFL